MKVKDMTDYLARFDQDEDLSIVILDIPARTIYPVEDVKGIKDHPFIGIEVSGSKPFTREQIEAAEEAERDAESQELRL